MTEVHSGGNSKSLANWFETCSLSHMVTNAYWESSETNQVSRHVIIELVRRMSVYSNSHPIVKLIGSIHDNQGLLTAQSMVIHAWPVVESPDYATFISSEFLERGERGTKLNW